MLPDHGCRSLGCAQENELTVDDSSAWEVYEGAHDYNAYWRGLSAEEREEIAPECNAYWRNYLTEQRLKAYKADWELPLIGEPLRTGEFLYAFGEDDSFKPVCLSLYQNGVEISTRGTGRRQIVTWSPFCMIWACRLDEKQEREGVMFRGLFKISLFQFAEKHTFAISTGDAESERARWIADIACSLRVFTKALFPPFRLAVEPVRGAPWTNGRVLAGYLLLCLSQYVCVVYCELHAHFGNHAAFCVYENEQCEKRVLETVHLSHVTVVNERMAVDCSCFTVDGYNFTARSVVERSLWLRALSNMKVKLRHDSIDPSLADLREYRGSVRSRVKDLAIDAAGMTNMVPMLPEFKEPLVGLRDPFLHHRPLESVKMEARGPLPAPDTEMPIPPTDRKNSPGNSPSSNKAVVYGSAKEFVGIESTPFWAENITKDFDDISNPDVCTASLSARISIPATRPSLSAIFSQLDCASQVEAVPKTHKVPQQLAVRTKGSRTYRLPPKGAATSPKKVKLPDEDLSAVPPNVLSPSPWPDMALATADFGKLKGKPPRLKMEAFDMPASSDGPGVCFEEPPAFVDAFLDEGSFDPGAAALPDPSMDFIHEVQQTQLPAPGPQTHVGEDADGVPTFRDALESDVREDSSESGRLFRAPARLRPWTQVAPTPSEDAVHALLAEESRAYVIAHFPSEPCCTEIPTGTDASTATFLPSQAAADAHSAPERADVQGAEGGQQRQFWPSDDARSTGSCPAAARVCQKADESGVCSESVHAMQDPAVVGPCGQARRAMPAAAVVRPSAQPLHAMPTPAVVGPCGQSAYSMQEPAVVGPCIQPSHGMQDFPPEQSLRPVRTCGEPLDAMQETAVTQQEPAVGQTLLLVGPSKEITAALREELSQDTASVACANGSSSQQLSSLASDEGQSEQHSALARTESPSHQPSSVAPAEGQCEQQASPACAETPSEQRASPAGGESQPEELKSEAVQVCRPKVKDRRRSELVCVKMCAWCAHR